MGFYLFILIRAIIIPILFFVITQSKAQRNWVWYANGLVLPIMWIIFLFFYPYAQLTLVCAFIGMIFFLVLCCKVGKNTDLKRFICINLFEIVSFYISSSFCSASDSPGGMGYIYFFSIELFSN